MFHQEGLGPSYMVLMLLQGINVIEESECVGISSVLQLISFQKRISQSDEAEMDVRGR